VAWPALEPVLGIAIWGGLRGVAVLSSSGESIEAAGALAAHEARALAAVVAKHGPADLHDQLFAGKVVASTHEGQVVYLAIAGRCLFVVAIADPSNPHAEHLAKALRDGIERTMREDLARSFDDWQPPPGSSGGSGSPPAEAFVFLPGRGRERPN